MKDALRSRGLLRQIASVDAPLSPLQRDAPVPAGADGRGRAHRRRSSTTRLFSLDLKPPGSVPGETCTPHRTAQSFRQEFCAMTEIDDKFQELLQDGLNLGALTSGEDDTYDGGTLKRFQFGVICCHPRVGASECHGAIVAEYMTRFEVRGELGYRGGSRRGHGHRQLHPADRPPFGQGDQPRMRIDWALAQFRCPNPAESPGNAGNPSSDQHLRMAAVSAQPCGLAAL